MHCLLLFFVYVRLLKVSLAPVLGEHRDDVRRLSSAWCLCLTELCSPGSRCQAWMTLVSPVCEDSSGNWAFFSKTRGFSLCCVRQSYFHSFLLSPVCFRGCCQWRERVVLSSTMVSEEKGGSRELKLCWSVCGCTECVQWCWK